MIHSFMNLDTQDDKTLIVNFQEFEKDDIIKIILFFLL